MNKTYRTLWNETTGTYVAVAETARARGKKSGSMKTVAAAVASALLMMGAGEAMAAVSGCTTTGSAPNFIVDDAQTTGCSLDSDNLTITGNGSIIANINPINVGSVAGSITNSGVIINNSNTAPGSFTAGDSAVYINGTITHFVNTNSISGHVDGLLFWDATVTDIVNSGTIAGVHGDALILGGDYTNPPWGTTVAGNISNSGTISGLDGNGIFIHGGSIGGSINNGGTGTISAQSTGNTSAAAITLWAGATVASITNSGRLTATMTGGPGDSMTAAGIALTSATVRGMVTNSGVIEVLTDGGTTSGAYGITIRASAVVDDGITNSGTITATRSVTGSVGDDTAAGIFVGDGSQVTGNIINSNRITAHLENYHPNDFYVGGTTTITMLANRAAGIALESSTVTGSIINSGLIEATLTKTFSGDEDVGNHVAGILLDGASVSGNIINTTTGSIISDGYGIILQKKGNETYTEVSSSGFWDWTATSSASSVGGSIINNGTITAGDAGIAVWSSSTVAGRISNSGRINAQWSGIAVDSSSYIGHGITNSGSGIISASGTGIYVGGSAVIASGGIVNSGSISAGNTGIYLGGGTSVTGNIVNDGIITAANAAIYLRGDLLTGSVINTNRLTGADGGIYVDSMSITGGITNSGSGSITATGGNAIYVYGATVDSILNEGHILATSSNAIEVRSGATIAHGITNAGTIESSGSTDDAIYLYSATIHGGVTNSGTISTIHHGIHVTGGLIDGSIINTADGVILAGDTAIKVSSSASISGGITNSGLVASLTSPAILVGSSSATLSGGIHNLSGGRIVGAGGQAMDLTEAFTTIDVLNEGTSASSRGTIVGAIDGNANVTNNGLWAMQQGTSIGGTVAGSVAQSTISGNFVQGSTGVLQVGVAGTGVGQYSTLTVGGTANVAGTIHVDVASAFDDVVNNGGTLAGVVTATGGLTATNLAVTDNSVLLSFGYLTTANALDLCVALQGSSCGSNGGGSGGGSTPIVTSLNNVGNTPATGAGGVLDQQLALYIANGTTGNAGMDLVLDELVTNHSDTDQALSDAVSQTLPLLTGGQSIAMGNALHGVNRIVQSRQEGQHGRSSGDQFFGDEHVWFKPFGSWANQDNRKGVSGYDASTYGMVFGLDGELNESSRIGAAFAYARSNVDSNSSIARQSADVDTYQLVVYGSHSLSPDTELSYQADYGRHNTEGQRRIAFIGSTAKSDYDSWSAHAGVGLAHTYSFGENTSLTPAVRIDYTRLEDDSYREKGAGALNLRVNDNSTEELILSVDGKLTHALSDKATFTANLGVGYDIINEQASLTAAFAGAPTAAFTTKGLDPSPWLGRAGLGIVGKVSDRLEVTARYDAEIRQDFDNQTASVKFRWAF